MDETPLYATLLYDVRRRLDISFTEYVYLDMVHKLSYGQWCTKSLEHCAFDLGLSRIGTIKMKNRLIARGLLRKNIKGHLKVTDAYMSVAVNKVTKPVNKVYPAGIKSIPKNNNRNTENKTESAFEVLERQYKKRTTVLPPYVVDPRVQRQRSSP